MDDLRCLGDKVDPNFTLTSFGGEREPVSTGGGVTRGSHTCKIFYGQDVVRRSQGTLCE